MVGSGMRAPGGEWSAATARHANVQLYSSGAAGWKLLEQFDELVAECGGIDDVRRFFTRRFRAPLRDECDPTGVVGLPVK